MRRVTPVFMKFLKKLSNLKKAKLDQITEQMLFEAMLQSFGFRKVKFPEAMGKQYSFETDPEYGQDCYTLSSGAMAIFEDGEFKEMA